ncbi:uncharacterized protein LOC129766702 [Toxorhynchites rutilus septentrionalis]|uniref:uncharacterized protein LOC129766702 n=1 Tax=Toxorhynchites rutilus septentrionalis TaxID=329112 RepID=UPI00247920DC|nr:uncharacterized protein LOC129766702 [Toxorhynchites rutilus septentrionalis]
MASLRELTKAERGYIDSLSNLESFIENFVLERDHRRIVSRLEHLEVLFKDFRENRAKIEARQDQDLKLTGSDEKEDQVRKDVDVANRKSRLDFEDRYFDIKDFLMSHRIQPTAVASTPHPPSQTSSSRVHLPVFKIPSFDGSVKDWLGFRDAFQSMIAKDTTLSPIDKFNYLLSVVTREARTLVESIEVTTDNFDVAWEMLEQRFENKKVIARTLMDSFLDAEPIKRESYDALVGLIDSYERSLLQLKKIGLKTEGWSHLIAHLLYKRLDKETQRLWERVHNSREAPIYEELLKFLRDHLATLQPLTSSKSIASVYRSEHSRMVMKSKIGSTLTTTTLLQKVCPHCQNPFHSPFKCISFNKMTPSQRLESVKKAGLCLNCLSSSHLVRACPSSACRVCGQRHHTMLHLRPASNTSNSGQEPSQSQPSNSIIHQHRSNSIAPNANNPSTSQSQTYATTPVTAPSMKSTTSTHMPVALPASVPADSSVVFLATAVVKIEDYYGNTLFARALLDGCSERNLMSEQLAQKLALNRKHDPLAFQGIGQSTANSKQSAMATIRSRCTDFVVDLKFHILPEFKPILPSNQVSIVNWNIPSHIQLADPQFFEPNQIDVIIGADIYFNLLCDGFVDLGPELPHLKETVFGWIVSGKCNKLQSTRPASTFVCSNAELEKQLTRFWEIESCHSNETLSVEERKCESHFTATTTRDPSGRFVVSLPKKPDVLEKLGNSRDIAIRRFLSLERRLHANPQLMEAYEAFIKEYVHLGHMILIDPTNDVSKPGEKIYYMPHHGIIRADSATTKLRVVFDASCPSDSGISLNDALMVGPVVQDELYSIILRFRIPRFVIVSDLEKMYRQLLVYPSDRLLQRIVFRSSPSEPIQTFELLTVTYGTASAPYLATRALKQLATYGELAHPDAAKVLVKDFYIDDLLCGVDSEEEGIKLCHQLNDLLQSAGFKLHKWASNSVTILQNIPVELREERNLLELDSSSTQVKTLGLLWQPVDDVFRFKIPDWSYEAPITKRLVLSEAARLFDPLGLLGPIVLRSKLFMQELWKAKVSWDDPLKENHQQFWKEFRKDLEILDTFIVPRWAAPITDPVSTELHGFSDASESAYGACIFLRTISATGVVSVHLLTAKSKVAPKATEKLELTIRLPRLELCGALLLSHLFEKVESSLQVAARPFFWTDSMIVMHWLAASPSRWKKFVSNRVAEIQQITASGVWGHVSGVENPADVISRGMPAKELIDHSLWWQGPPWLQQPNRFWPEIIRTSDNIFTQEQLQETPVVALPAVVHSTVFSIKSSLSNLVRLVAYIRRFCRNATKQNRQSRSSGPLSTAELEEALICLVKLSQQESFAADLQSIRTTGHVKPTSKLKALVPVLVDGVLRTRGRLNHAAVPYAQKQPMILDHKHPFTLLVVRHYHLNRLHAGPTLLAAIVRTKFWPLRLRDLTRKITHECVTCFRTRPNSSDQVMADLPLVRVTPALPFLNSGVDFCGPFYLRPPTRKSAPLKVFVAVFVCLSTKAIHLELVGNLSTDSFIACLKRFAARRGIPKTIYCDNATNFVGARRTLNEFVYLFSSQQNRMETTRHCTENGIQFSFIPPRSPHFGGIWEAAVKSLKTHLHRTLANAMANTEQFTTLLVQIEALLNSRPLTQLSNDPEDLDVLTPGHFLVHRPLTAIPEPSYEEIPTNRLSQWQMIQEYLRRIWKRWSTEYLSGLQQRTKWTKVRDNIRIGTMVLVREENLPPQKWRFGRVVEVFPGSDGLIRVVSIRTKDGIYKRAITRICVLPIADNLPDRETAAFQTFEVPATNAMLDGRGPNGPLAS